MGQADVRLKSDSAKYTVSSTSYQSAGKKRKRKEKKQATYRAKVREKPFYVVHVDAIIFLKLVHPEGEKASWMGRGEREGGLIRDPTMKKNVGTMIEAWSYPSLSMCGRCFGVPLRCFLWKWLKSSFSGCTSQPAPLQPGGKKKTD